MTGKIEFCTSEPRLLEAAMVGATVFARLTSFDVHEVVRERFPDLARNRAGSNRLTGGSIPAAQTG
jgi:hypothetical protein